MCSRFLFLMKHKFCCYFFLQILTIQKAGQYELPSLQKENAILLNNTEKRNGSSDKSRKKKSCC